MSFPLAGICFQEKKYFSHLVIFCQANRSLVPFLFSFSSQKMENVKPYFRIG